MTPTPAELAEIRNHLTAARSTMPSPADAKRFTAWADRHAVTFMHGVDALLSILDAREVVARESLAEWWFERTVYKPDRTSWEKLKRRGQPSYRINECYEFADDFLKSGPGQAPASEPANQEKA